MPAAKDSGPTDRQTDGPIPSTQSRKDATRADRRQQERRIAAAVIGTLVVVFALINLNDVKVHWLITTQKTPLIVVIALAFVLGILADRLLLARAKKKHGAGS
jgi:uncharacterized integral membrane protein